MLSFIGYLAHGIFITATARYLQHLTLGKILTIADRYGQ
jgi:hypothetical protein